MIKNNQRIFNALQVVVDAVVIAVSYVLAWYLKFHSGLFSHAEGALSVNIYMRALLFVVPGYLILYRGFRLYMPRRMQSSRRELWNIVRANGIGLMAFILVLYFIRQEDFSREMILLFLVGNILLESVVRLMIRCVLWSMRKQGYNQKHILLAGYSRAAEQYLKKLQENPHWGYQVVGLLSNEVKEETICGVKVLGSIDRLEEILEENPLDEVVITLGLQEHDQLGPIVESCEKAGVHTKFVPDYGTVIPTRPYIEDVEGMPVINIRRIPLKTPFNRMVKRGMDIFGALSALVLFSPVMAVTALLVKATTPGPVIFKQERVGFQNKTFWMYKFRSMVVQDEESEKQAWGSSNDPRVTKVGKWIRKTSVDELPQLINVLKGEMSLVGPRPERPQFVEKFKDEIPRYMVKHQVRPGMTGWAQVKGYRGDTSIQKRIEHDLYYIENWTMGLDIKIIILTLCRGFVNKEKL